MSFYRFSIFQGESADAQGQEVDLPDSRAAWNQACSMCRDLSRTIFTDAKPEWKLEVSNELGKTIFRFRVLAEVL
ncbi:MULTISPECIES: hypothetical protein [Rhodopseudomonas]|uniref:DUF6894 family protein n=1 Tax=Rhodopseudomonas TaxID=1073 RepID=UPI0005C82F5C|nr:MULTISPECIES: hypothetical protein [Rhodopseudomonas]MDF3810760.1 hypothetical protein [Rhodopseudomonas sp. BAL398]WOK20561.1 hypothetical protein RBJ75_14040 [Rhodopseudomonas sp. BAL398]